MECGGLPPLLTAGACPCAANGGKPPLRKRRQAAALHITARGLSTLIRNLDLKKSVIPFAPLRLCAFARTSPKSMPEAHSIWTLDIPCWILDILSPLSVIPFFRHSVILSTSFPLCETLVSLPRAHKNPNPQSQIFRHFLLAFPREKVYPVHASRITLWEKGGGLRGVRCLS